MKKLICAAAMSALCATVFAIESENIVGYQQITVGTGYHLFTVTFGEVGNTDGTFNINGIKVYQNGEEYATNNRVSLQKMDETGTYLTTYNYRKSKGGWCQLATLKTDITLEPGESFCVNNTTGAPIQLKFKSPISTAE